MITANLPIFKASLDLTVYVDKIVKNFEKYHKYTFGEDLRVYSKNILFLINRANISKDKQRVEYITKLRDKCEDLKMLILLGKELKAFKSFNQFQYISKLTVDVAKQSQNWLNYCARILK